MRSWQSDFIQQKSESNRTHRQRKSTERVAKNETRRSTMDGLAETLYVVLHFYTIEIFRKLFLFTKK